MTVCMVCGEEDFDVRDGHFFCTTCLTQSQDIRQEEEEEEFVTPLGHTLAIKVPKQKEKIKPVDYTGRPWHTYEGFLIIIREQVQALIKLGAPKTLEDKVFRLWCTYLSKTGIAFPEDISKIHPKLKKCQRHRERFPGTMEDASVKPVMIRNYYRNNYGTSEQEFEAEMANREVANKVQKEQFYEGDNPLDENAAMDDTIESVGLFDEQMDSPGSDDDDDNDDGGDDGGKIKVKIKSFTRKTGKEPNYNVHIEWMNMMKTLCFCYLGLIYSNCLVTAADITRWAKQGKIPYYNVTQVFPEDMKLFNYDFKTFFCGTVPRSCQIQYTAEKLANFLGLTELPELPVTKLIHKYIIELELPAELHGYVVNLLHAKPLGLELNRSIHHYETMAMVYIITTLQLLLGLDDFTERKLSEYAKQINKLLNDDNRLFIWEDWSSHINNKIFSLKAQQIFAKEFDSSYVKNVDQFMEHFHILSNKRNPRCSGKTAKEKFVKSCREVTRDAIQKPIQMLIDKWSLSSKSSKRFSDEDDIDSNEDHESDTEYNPDACSTLLEEDPVGFKPLKDQDQYSKKSEEISFRAKSMKYLTQTDKFLDELDKHGLADFTINSSCVESTDSSDSEDSDIAEDGQTRSHNDTDRKQKQSKPKNSSKSAVRHLLSTQDTTRHKSKFIDKKKFSDIIQNLIEMREDFKFNKSFKNSANQSRAYRWLMEICSSFIDCDSDELEKELHRLQDTL